MQHAKSYRDLEIYQRARSLANDIYEVTKSFPKEETYSLMNKADQFCSQP